MKPMAEKTNIQRISRASRLFIRLLQALMVLVPMADAAVWIFINDLIAPMQKEMLPYYVRLPLPASARVLAFCVSLIPLSLFVFADATLIRLFGLYEKGLI